jgi:hypothetical protein
MGNDPQQQNKTTKIIYKPEKETLIFKLEPQFTPGNNLCPESSDIFTRYREKTQMPHCIKHNMRTAVYYLMKL